MRLGQLVVDTTPLRTSRSFRLVVASRVIVLVSAGLLAVAVPVQVYALTSSSVQVGLVSAALGAGLLVGFLAGGVLADGLDRRRVIVASGLGITATFALLALNAAVPSGRQLAVIYVVTVGGGLIQGIGETALTAVAPSLVPPEQLAPASGLVAATSMLGAVIGPAAGGAVVAGPGLVANYLLAALMVAVATVLLARLRLPGDATASGEPGDGSQGLDVVRSVVEGLAFVRRDPLIRGILLIDLCATVFGVPTALFPQLADERFGAGPELVGVLTTAPAVGALVGAVASGWTGRIERPGRALVASILVLGASYVGFGLSGHLAFTLGFLALTGLADTVSEILRRALLQFHTPDPLQGRVNSLWLAQATSSSAFGGLSAGAGARILGPGGAMVAAGTLCMASAAALSCRLPELRRARLSRPTPEPPPSPPAPLPGPAVGAPPLPLDLLPEQKGTQ